ncbi:MAG TPA: hypothetical protein VMU84_10330, partial [Thermoanaerobaculia bacterium]|nr:hypothetical protein [Thermoanaerobaculia bacterium]
FPLALGLKTTLASLLLLFGVFSREHRQTFLAWLAAAIVILLIAIPSKLDLGVRYILPIYAPLTIAMAAATTAMLKTRALRIVAIVLLAWHCVASVVAHPEYFAYFNELAQPDPSQFLVDSNLDWGQDVLLLRHVLREEHATRVGIALVGMHAYEKLGFPQLYAAAPDTPSHGWIAISDHMYRYELAKGGWWWLRGQKFRRIGASIRLYNVP